MGLRGAWLCSVLLVGCGRIGFDDRAGDGSTGPGGCPPSAVLCDDFESGDLSHWNGVAQQGTSTRTEVTTTRARSGQFAFEATVPASPVGGEAAALFFLPSQGSTLAVRQWINAPDGLNHFDLVIVLRNGTTGRYLTAGVDNLANWVMTEADGAGGNVDHSTTVPGPPVDTWVCVEMLVSFAAPAHAQLFVDGSSLTDAALIDPAPAYLEVQSGAARGATEGFHVFVDDVVVAHERIGCNSTRP